MSCIDITQSTSDDEVEFVQTQIQHTQLPRTQRSSPVRRGQADALQADALPPAAAEQRSATALPAELQQLALQPSRAAIMATLHNFCAFQGKRMVVLRRSSGGANLKVVCESAVRGFDQAAVDGGCPAFACFKRMGCGGWGIKNFNFKHLNCTSSARISARALANLTNFRDAMEASKGKASAPKLCANVGKNNGFVVSQ